MQGSGFCLIIISVVFHLCCSEDGISVISLKNYSASGGRVILVVTIVVILVSSLAVNNAVINQIDGTSRTLVDSSRLQIVDV